MTKHLAVITGIAAIGVGGAAAAQVVVLQAEGPSADLFQAGTMLATNKLLELNSGDRLTVMDAAGARTIEGPGSFPPNRPSAARDPKLDALLGQFRPGSTAGFHAARGETSRPLTIPSNIWQVAFSTKGNFCFASGEPAALWREQADAAQVTITQESTGQTLTLDWPAGNHSIIWPTALPLAEDEQYSISTSDDAPGVIHHVYWHEISPPATGWPEFAKQLEDNGCDGQLETIVAAMPPPNS